MRGKVREKVREGHVSNTEMGKHIPKERLAPIKCVPSYPRSKRR